MLDFLGLAPSADGSKNRPEAFGCPLELVNVAARGREVKYLFVIWGSRPGQRPVFDAPDLH